VQFAADPNSSHARNLTAGYVSPDVVMRHFAGPMAHKFSPVGLLWISCLLASLGLISLSVANSPITGLLAATVWGTGVCYMWPTMLAAASERFPRGRRCADGLRAPQECCPSSSYCRRWKSLRPLQSAGRRSSCVANVIRVVAVLPAVAAVCFWSDMALRPLTRAAQTGAAHACGKD